MLCRLPTAPLFTLSQRGPEPGAGPRWGWHPCGVGVDAPNVAAVCIKMAAGVKWTHLVEHHLTPRSLGNTQRGGQIMCGVRVDCSMHRGVASSHPGVRRLHWTT